MATDAKCQIKPGPQLVRPLNSRDSETERGRGRAMPNRALKTGSVCDSTDNVTRTRGHRQAVKPQPDPVRSQSQSRSRSRPDPGPKKPKEEHTKTKYQSVHKFPRNYNAMLRRRWRWWRLRDVCPGWTRLHKRNSYNMLLNHRLTWTCYVLHRGGRGLEMKMKINKMWKTVKTTDGDSSSSSNSALATGKLKSKQRNEERKKYVK